MAPHRNENFLDSWAHLIGGKAKMQGKESVFISRGTIAGELRLDFDNRK